MEYSISKTNKLLIISCSSLVILYYLLTGLPFGFVEFKSSNQTTNTIINILFNISSAYIWFTFVRYFNFYKLNFLRNLSISILVFQILWGVLGMPYILPDFMFTFLTSFNILLLLSSTRLILIVSTIVWLILLFRLNREGFSAIRSLRYYALGIVIANVSSVAITVITMYLECFEYSELAFLPLLIPYIFIVDFAMKLKLKNDVSLV